MNLDLGQPAAKPACACYTHRMQATLASILAILVIASIATTASLWRDQLALCSGLLVLIAVLSSVSGFLSVGAAVWSCVSCRGRPSSPVCAEQEEQGGYAGYKPAGDNPLTESREVSDSRPLVPVSGLHEDGAGAPRAVCCPMCKCRGKGVLGTLGRICFWLTFALFVVSVLGSFALAGITVDLFATTLPNKKSSIKLKGLNGEVAIHREASGMFHVEASSMHDVAFGQGVAHAQDRLWQMEFQRRVGRGTLSAAVGKGGLKFDKFMRTLGVYKAAQAAVPLIDTDPLTAELLDGYLAGVNAYIDTKPFLPLEMKVLGIKPEPFTRADSIVWAKIMSYDLSENWKRETLRHQLLVGRNVSAARIEQLMPFFQVDRFPTVLENEDLPPSQRNTSAPEAFQPLDTSADAAVAEQLLALARERKATRASRQLLREAETEADKERGVAASITRALRKSDAAAATGCGGAAGAGWLQRAFPPAARNSAAFLGAYLWSFLSGDVSALASHLLPDKELTPAGSLFAGSSPDGGPSIGSQASNNWVVGPQHTATGKPLMANDPHLALSAPSIWIVNHLHVTGPNPTGDATWDAIGSSFPLLPGIVLGHNNHISWAVTNTGADVQDLFVMNDTASGGDAYWYRGAWVPYNTTQEVIQVKGQDDVTITVRGTVYGNVVTDNDVTNATMSAGSTMALRWVSTDPTIPDTTLLAFMRMSVAKNYTEWRDALKHYVAPSQNFIFADALGNISYQMPGWIPHRTPAHSGAFPVPGNGDAAWEWQGRVPFDALPRTLNPPKGYIVTANNKVTPSQYTQYRLTPYNRGWNSLSVGYRAKRITDMVHEHSSNGSKVTMAAMRAMQGDYRSYLADDVLAGVARADRSALTANGQAVFDKLMQWDRIMAVGGETPVLFAFLVSELTVLGTAETGGQQWTQFGFLYNALQSDTSPGGSDPACGKLGFSSCTAFVQTCLDRTGEFYDTLQDEHKMARLRQLPVMRKHLSKDEATHWGKSLHPALFAHAILGKTPLACLANRFTQHGGDWSTVNVGAFTLPSQLYMQELRSGKRNKDEHERRHSKVDEDDALAVKWQSEMHTPLFMQTAGPSYRGVYDLATVGASAGGEESVFLNPLGQSGNILSSEYDNLLQDWSTTQYLAMLTRGFEEKLTQKLKPE